MRKRKKKDKVSDSEILEFTQLITKLDPIEFLGIDNILQIQLLNPVKNNAPREFEELFSDIIDRYITLSRAPRKEILDIMRQANKSKFKN